MFKAFAVILSFVLSAQFSAASQVNPPTHSAIKGYLEWKREKIQQAVIQMANVRAQMLKAQAEGPKKTAENLERQHSQLQWNLEVARDLSVTDYFVLYLSQQSQPDRFQQAALKMSTAEVAELIEAYAYTLGGGPSDAVVKPAVQAQIPSKLPMQAIQGK